ncbi:MvdC/MvdD family ATP grasp protein [Corallococcus silvisoli]|uniref:MvdC/MvdD family ATP grasp protein n=1 Tax=Corallococcus silvisoli TaxID=2697031 RepID=UPI0013773437|nr:hypothetical protein [Corallococcus silvisoli]NBD12953.1 hypothetical protein [Corallococcus silvisoli]
MILLVTDPGDRHAYALEGALRQKGAETFRFHPEDLPLAATLTLYPGVPQESGWLRGERGDLRLDSVRSVWRRTRRPFALPLEWSDLARQYTRVECTESVSGLYLHLRERFWVNPPWRLRHGADNKALQLRVAQESGLETPLSLVTSESSAAQEFFRQCEGHVLRLSLRTHPSGGGAGRPLEEVVSLEQLQDVELFHRAPLLLQQLLPVVARVWVVVVGCQLFAAEAPAGPVGRSRARRAPRLRPHSLPEATGGACLRMMRRLGLASATLELGLVAEARYVFLRLDAQGDWLPLEREARLPVLECLAELLLQGGCERERTADAGGMFPSDA